MARLRHLILCTAALVATACGSTVATTDQAAEGLSAPGLEAPSDVGSGSTGTALGSTGSPTLTTGDAPGGSTTQTQEAAGRAAVGSVQAPRATDADGTPARDPLAGAPGVTAKTIKIGVEIEGDAAATRAAYGVKNPAYDYEPSYRAVAADLNRRGGLAGRKVELVFAYTDLKSGTFDEQAERACQQFVQDNKVYAAIITIDRSRGLGPCVAKRGTIALQYFTYSFHALDVLDRYADRMFLPLGLTYPRFDFLIDGLVQQGFLTKSNRIGLIGWDDPVHVRYLDQVLKPRLAAYGMKEKAQALMYATPTLSGLGQSGADVQNAVLRFKAENIDRVIFVATGGVGPLFFLPGAESQAYHPKYGLSSMESIESFRPNVPASQLEGSRGVGWFPLMDLNGSGFKTSPSNLERRRCADIMKRSGTAMPARSQEFGAAVVCSPLFFLEQSLNRMVAGAGSFRTAVQGLGSAFRDPLTMPLHFGAGRRNDGIASYRALVYDVPCGCFRYDGPVHALR